jgi:hypothetical protein
LNPRSLCFLFLYTSLTGMILMPAAIYLQDASAGQTSELTGHVVLNLAVEGFLLGSVVAVVMFLAFKFLLQMGWLPSRK